MGQRPRLERWLGPGACTKLWRTAEMVRQPLFSTYRAGENRVTSSILAVFQRIDLSLVERLLGEASGESSRR